MADLRISELNTLPGAGLVAGDYIAIADNSASETRKITVVDYIGYGVTLLADDTIPSGKILFNAETVPGSALENLAVDTDQIANGSVTATKLADFSSVTLVGSLPASGAFRGQIALDTNDLKIYSWDGSQWLQVKAAGSINTIVGGSAGVVNVTSSQVGDTVTLNTTLDDTTVGGQFLAGPTGTGGAVAYRTINSTDLPTATTTAKGAVLVNGEGLTLNGDKIEIDNTITPSSAEFHVVEYDEKGLVTSGRLVSGSDIPAAQSSTKGAVFPGSGLSVLSSGELNHSNSVTAGTYGKVTVDTEGHVTAGLSLEAADIPDLPASKITTETFPPALIGNSTITGAKLADNSVTKFGGAGATDNVVTFPDADFKGQFFYDEKNEDLYVYTGSSFVPITVISGNLILAGTYDASANLVDSVTTQGSAAGFATGSALPSPATTNRNYYVVVSTSGTGSGAAPAVALAPPDMLLSTGGGAEFALLDISNAIAGQTASNISVTPAGNISSVNVQAALQELDSEKIGGASPTLSGTIDIASGATIVFEGSTANDYETTLTVVDPTSDHTITFPDATGNVVTTGDTGTVTSTMIADCTIINADINANAEIAVSKLADGAARQLLQTDVAGTGVEWTDNVDIPGTLDVTGAATFDGTARFIGNVTLDAGLVLEGSTADAVETTLTVVDPTADNTITLPDATTTVAGLAVTQSFTKAQRGAVVVLTDNATITPDFTTGNNFSVELGGNRTLANPSNLTAGQSGVIVVTQDGTGSRTLAFGSYWKFAGGTAPTLTTTASAVDVIAYYVESATRITAQTILNVS